MLDILLLALQIVTLVLLFLFIWWVVRSARSDLDRSAQRPPPQTAGWDGRSVGPPAGGYAPPPRTEPAPSAPVAVADWAARPEPADFSDRPASGDDAALGRDVAPPADLPVAPIMAAGAGAAAAEAAAEAPLDQTAGRETGGPASGAAAPHAGNAAADVQPRLVVESSPVLDKGSELDLGRWLGMGRSPASDVPLDDPFVSATHARVGRRDGITFVEDLGSTNGTFVNERRVSQEELRPGVRLRVGETVFRYEE